MTIAEWEQYTITADLAMQDKDYLRSILHYLQALRVSEELMEDSNVSLDDQLTINIVSCHNLANFWRLHGNEEYELKYLQLASENMVMLVPQCPHRDCETFLDSLGCCRKALINFMKRHPNPEIAKQVQHIETTTHCEIIAKFKLN